ncbi:hypothetical protein D3C75_586900 [compost metagenome]
MEKKLYLLVVEQELELVMEAICRAFGLENEGTGNTIGASNGRVELAVSVFTKDMEETQAFFKEQVNAVWGHFHGVDTEYTDNKLNVLYQIQGSGSFVIVKYSCADEDTDQETALLEQLAGLLQRTEGLLLADNGTRILDKELRLILSDEGDSELDGFFPAEKKLPPDFFDGAPPERVARRNRSVEFLRGKGIYVTEWLPLIEGEEETRFRTVQEVAQRAAALLTVALHAEVLMTQSMDVKKARSYSDSVTKAYGCKSAFSPEEQKFLKNKAPEEREVIRFSWQYECLSVMLWALGLIEELPFPDRICDVGGSVRIMSEHNSLEKLIGASTLRSHKELLDEADLIYRMDWGCVDARIKGLPMPRELEGGVVMERHKCLNWLIGSDNAEWDNVDVST